MFTDFELGLRFGGYKGLKTTIFLVVGQFLYAALITEYGNTSDNL